MLKEYENFEVEDLGVQEEWVYDIEVEDNHNFFGNDILVHNSVYFSIEPFMLKYQEKNPGLAIGEYVEWADQFEKKIVAPIVQKTIDDFAEQFNAYNKDIIGVEREVIADSSIFVAKKKYLARVRDSEGSRYADDAPEIKVVGLEVKKSGTPVWAKKYLKESIPRMLDDTESELRTWVNEIKSEFTKVNLNEIAMMGGISSLNYDLEDSGVPFGARAALYHNKYVRENGLGEKYSEIQPGDKCKRLHLTVPNRTGAKLIAFTNEQFVEELDGVIDYDTQFEKGFLNSLKLMTNALGYDLDKRTASLDDW